MKQLIKNLLETKTNIFGTIAIACLASLVTSTAMNWANDQPGDASNQTQLTNVAIPQGPSVVDCETGVYSPVQNKCVSKVVFNQEMQRLFAALGINSSIYGTNQPSTE